MATHTVTRMEEELSSCPMTRVLLKPMARLLFDGDPTRCLLYINIPLRPGHKSSRPPRNLDTARTVIPSISDNPHHHPVLKLGAMDDLNLDDLEMGLISNHTLKSTLPLDLAQLPLMSMIIAMRMDMLIWPRAPVKPRKVMVILTVKRVMDMITDLPVVMTMVTRMVVVVTRMDR
jgi:hypothetical protein